MDSTTFENTSDFLQYLKKHAKVSNKETNIFDSPFFPATGSEDFETLKCSPEELATIPIIKTFPTELETMYYYVGDKEVSLHDFTFLRPSEIEKNYKRYSYFYDVALKYQGMGHLQVISVTKDNKYFLRNDGGSNGYERADNYEKYVNFEPKNTMTFSELVNKIKNPMSFFELHDY
jgi:hypothetical protein